VRLTYLGTAMIELELAGQRLVTDPVLDPAGSTYDFGPWYAPRAWFSSEKTYESPPAVLTSIDAVLLSHDHHADNLDHAGRRLIESAAVARVVTTVPGARRLGLGGRAIGLSPGATTSIGPITVTATPARHGPPATPKVHQVTGFLLAAPGEPTIWISGDTVLYPALRDYLAGLGAAGVRVDVAVVHCGGVGFPRVPVLGAKLFTFDAAQAIEACRLLEPTPALIVPIHRDGWTHFRQPEAALRDAFTAAGLAERTRFLALGEELTYSPGSR
jgi:L-ascorbate metabolism protein UlaG (beta-lactamase superfamily)